MNHLRPVPPHCPFCDSLPEIDALCYFSCECNEDYFRGEFKLIDIDDIDKGYEITWFALSRGVEGKRIEILVEYRERRHTISYNKESHLYCYNDGEEIINLDEAKCLLDKYCKMKAFL